MISLHMQHVNVASFFFLEKYTKQTLNSNNNYWISYSDVDDLFQEQRYHEVLYFCSCKNNIASDRHIYTHTQKKINEKIKIKITLSGEKAVGSARGGSTALGTETVLPPLIGG